MRIAAVFVLILLTCALASAQVPVEIWYGNLDGSPIEAPIGSEILVPVYVQTASDVNEVYASVMLGTDDQYVISRDSGNRYAPFDSWAGGFFGPFADSPDPGITTEEWTGIDYSYSNQLHFETPTLVLEFRMTVSSDPGLIGQTVEALVSGFNPDAPAAEEQTTFFVRNNVETMDYPVEHFSMITFVEGPQIPTLSQWGLIIFGLLLITLLTAALIRVRHRKLSQIALLTITLFAFAAFPLNPDSASGEQGQKIENPEPLVYCSQYSYAMGDYNGNGIVNVFDLIFAFYWLTLQGVFPSPYLSCECCADGQFLYVTLDVNADCTFNLIDLAVMMDNRRTGSPAFVAPACL